MDNQQARAQAERVEALLARAEELPEPARSVTADLVRALLELYGAGLTRILATVEDGDGADSALLPRLAGDELVGYLLLLHDLHPVDLPTRVATAVEAVGPRLRGATVELVEIRDGTVHLRLSGGGGCGSSAARDTLTQAVRAAAPEIQHVELTEPGPAPVLIPLSSLRVGSANAVAGG